MSLAALVKGRSSSRHLNKEIRASIPDHVVSNVRPFYGFVRSKLNPADDPTRDAPLRRPSKEQALWMQELKKGNCDSFDAELSKWGLDLQQLRGLPEESELWRKMPDNLLNGRQKKFSTWAQNKKKKQPMQPAWPVTQVEHSLPVGGLGRPATDPSALVRMRKPRLRWSGGPSQVHTLYRAPAHPAKQSSSESQLADISRP